MITATIYNCNFLYTFYEIIFLEYTNMWTFIPKDSKYFIFPIVKDGPGCVLFTLT